MKKILFSVLVFTLLVPFLPLESHAVQRNVITRSKAESRRQHRQQQFGVRAFQKKGTVEVKRKSSRAKRVTPAHNVHIFGSGRARIGIQRKRVQRKSPLQSRGTVTNRRRGIARTSTSYKKQVRNLKGNKRTSLRERGKSFMRNKTNQFDVGK